MGAAGALAARGEGIALVRPPYTRHGARKGGRGQGLRFEYTQLAILNIYKGLPPRGAKLNMTILARKITNWLRMNPDKECRAIVVDKPIDRHMARRALRHLWEINPQSQK